MATTGSALRCGLGSARMRSRTSQPDTSGICRSSSSRSGISSWSSSRHSMPEDAVRVRVPWYSQRSSTIAIESSSSSTMTRCQVAGLLGSAVMLVSVGVYDWFWQGEGSWQGKREGTALTDGALNLDRAVHGLGKALRDGETKSCTSKDSGIGVIDLFEDVEDFVD